MNLSIQKRNLRLVYYIVLTILIFFLMVPGDTLPSIYRISLLILIFFPIIYNVEVFPFVFVTFYGISSISFTPVLPTSDIYYIIIVIVFYSLNRKGNNKKFLIGSLLIYSYFLICSLLHFDYTSSLTWLLLAILICDMIRDEKDLQQIFYAFIIVGLFLSILFIVHKESFSIQYDSNSLDIERSVWINPNIFGAHIALGGLVSVSYLLNMIQLNTSRNMKIICTITLILTSIVLILNASRGALLGFIIPSLFMFLISKIKILYKLLVIILVVCFISWMYTNNIFDLLLLRLAEDNFATGGGRSDIWNLKLELFIMSNNIPNLLFGIGETATTELGRYVSTHNDIVTVIIAYGIIGFLIFTYFVIVYPIVKAKNNKLFVFILLIYIMIECCVLEPFFRSYIIIIMFYFTIIKYSIIRQKTI